MASFMSMSGLPPMAPHALSQDVLENAGRLLDKHLQDDRTYPDLSDELGVPVHNQPSVSGLNEFDYPSLPETRVGLDCLSEISNVKRVPLPPELVEQFGRMQCNCMMGLFADVERAWLTIDSDIFVWRYEDGSDLAYFDGLGETILSVALVKPKPGIFQPHIQYLLCLATPMDIVLLGVSFTRPFDGVTADSGYGEMHLLPEPLFSIPADNIYIMNIIGADNGRIFMAGKDGCLYEVIYQADDGWFSRKCRKVNHSTSTLSFLVPSFLNFTFSEDDPLVQLSIDKSRHILYARSEKGTIQVFDLGSDGKGMGKVTSIPLQTIVHNAAHIAKTIERSNFKPIVHISAMTMSDSVNLHLVAVTQSGVRLYFTTNPFNNRGRPNMLSLAHVRLPPGFSATGGPQKPSKIHTAYHKKGTLLLVSSQTEDRDLLWTISGDTFPFQSQLMEAQTTIPLDGKTWAMCEVPTHPEPITRMPQDISLMKADPPAVVTQHIEAPRRFVLLSAQGSHILSKLRPVDQLRQLLIDCRGPDSDEVKGFFRLHKIEQACATCLILACSRLAADQPVANWATMAFFMYGGEAQYCFGGTGMSMDHTLIPTNIGPTGIPHGMHPQQTSTPAPGMGHAYFHPTLGQPSSIPQEVSFSGKHNGICLYLSRILRLAWDTNVAMDYPCVTPQGTIHYLTCSFSSEELNMLLEHVRGLSDFVDFNSRFDMGSSESNSMPMMTPHIMAPMDDQMRKRLQGEAQKMEKISLQHIQELVHRVEEVLGLLKILVDHQFHVVINSLTQDQQTQLRTLSFKQLVINGKDMCGALITCLINRYLDDNATIDAINGRLREICPSLYSSDDATCSKANELLQLARVNENQKEKEKQLNEALKLYKDVSHPLQLREVCNQFINVHFFDGIVDLCLTMAKKRDPQNLAIHFYNNGERTEDDIQGSRAHLARLDCYSCVTHTLELLFSASVSHPQAPSVPKAPGPPPTPDPSLLTAADAELFKSEVFRLALKSDDELFHVALYDWLFNMNLTEKLLEIQSPYMEPYLKRKHGAIWALDMLWKYYEKCRNFPAAAKILTKLAERHGTDVRLQQRMEYLSRAIMCAKSSTSRTSSAAEGEFLHELEEKMEVARLQLQVLKALSNLSDNLQQIQEAVNRLDSDLLDLTTLYEDFADPFELSECKLAIVHCAGLYDGALIENLWQNIIDKEIDSAPYMVPQQRVINIKNKIGQVGQLYIKTERYFPLAFIVKYMEQRSCKLGFTVTWVFEMMLDIGVSRPKLLEIYDRMFKSRDPFWTSVQRPLWLLEVLCEFIRHLINDINVIPVYERSQFTTLCLDSIAAYLVELQAMGSTTQLVQQFRRLQAELERLERK